MKQSGLMTKFTSRKCILIFVSMLYITLISCSEDSLSQPTASGAQFGANFNHNPEIMDFYYLRKAKAKWIRTTPRIFDFIDGHLDAETFQFARSILTEKPIIVTEFSLHCMYKAHLSETIWNSEQGKEFARLYGRDPDRNGDYSSNPLCFDDFVSIVQQSQ